MRVKVARNWIDIGPRVMGSMDYALHEAMFAGNAPETIAAEAEPTDVRATVYSGNQSITGRLASVREWE